MEDKKIVTLMDEEGQPLDLEVVEILEMDDEKYALLAPIGEEEDAYVYKIVEAEGREEYVVVEDDDEFERVLEEYNSYFDEE
ncbi:DUF1292 domain-containing protein [Clostridiaceae bacterium 35-E11]